jgi:orotate phosphoribosyltransferase
LALETGIPFIALREVPEAAPLSFAALGEVHAGERVVVVEDVVKSGSRALAAARAIERSGAIVDRVLCVIDREEGGSALLSEAGLLLEPLFTARELLVTPGRAPGSRGGR